MSSTLTVSKSLIDPRLLEDHKTSATSQLGNWSCICNHGITVLDRGVLPLSADTVGNPGLSLRDFDGTMGFDTSRLAEDRHGTEKDLSHIHTPNPPYSGADMNPFINSSPDYLNSYSSDEVRELLFQAVSPEIPPNLEFGKRGRPQRSHAAAAAALTIGGTGKSKRHPSTRSDADISGSDDSRVSRIREKNRIAAAKCRSRRRVEEDKLKSKHNNLEREHQKLSSTLLDLMAEMFVLKNILMEHGNCDCKSIQGYLKEAISECVAKKLHVAQSLASPSPGQSGFDG